MVMEMVRMNESDGDDVKLAISNNGGSLGYGNRKNEDDEMIMVKIEVLMMIMILMIIMMLVIVMRF